jgi:hypothetical protein
MNNPLGYTDPSGYRYDDDLGSNSDTSTKDEDSASDATDNDSDDADSQDRTGDQDLAKHGEGDYEKETNQL